MGTRRKRDLQPTSWEADLEVRFIDCYKGSGVFALNNIPKGELLTNYGGKLISKEEGNQRHEHYTVKDGSFLFFFTFEKRGYCIDATHYPGIGRMINDNHRKPNSKVVVEKKESGPTLCIYSMRQILKGEEISFDYQDPSVPWRKKNFKKEKLFPEPEEHGSENGNPEFMDNFSNQEFLHCDHQHVPSQIEVITEGVITEGVVKKNVLFSGSLPNQGFFKLFGQYQLTDTADNAEILIVPSSEFGNTPNASLKLFQCLVGRKVEILSKTWVKHSLVNGSVKDTKKYLVKSITRYGDISEVENYQPFEFQIIGTDWVDITGDNVRNLLKKMGGTEVLTVSTDTIIVCADGQIHSSDQCVSKEWIFQSIVEGSLKNIKKNEISGSSDDESEIIKYQAFTPGKKIHIQTSGSVTNSKRSQKRQSCLYCQELHTKISRHLATKHASEIEVAKILNLPKGSKQRRKAWIDIEAKGNYCHNIKVHESGKGMIIPKYRPTVNKDEKKYLPCQFCKAFIVSSDLWKHHKTCVGKPTFVKSDAPVKNSRLLLPVNCSPKLHEDVICKMRDDLITATLKSDPLIKEIGERKYSKTGKYQHTHQHIAQRMRELSRFLLAMKKRHSNISSLRQCIDPLKWKSVILAVKDISGFDFEQQNYKSPSLALKVGHSLKKCARVLRNEANEIGDDCLRERTNRFIELYEDEWGELVSSSALDSLSTVKYNTVKLLPLVEDVVALSRHISTKKQQAKSYESQILAYTMMCKYILAEIILFNRRRSGEADRLKRDDYLKASLNPNVDEEIKRNLSKFEQELCHSHIRVETRGKRGRKFAILFTTSMKESVDFLLKLQEDLGFTTKYIFVPPNKSKPYRGTNVLKEIADEAGLKHPDRITSTNLRKQLGTLCQVLGLTDTQQDILARFMGHDIRVHRDFYRLPQGTIEIAKISKVLHCLNSGKLAEVKDKGLDEINVNDDLVLDGISDVDDEEEEDDDDDDKIKSVHDKEQEQGKDNQISDQCDSSDEEWRPPYKKYRASVLESDSDDSSVNISRGPARKHKSVFKGRTPWGEVEGKIVLSAFQQNLILKKLPGKLQCEQLISQHAELKNRTWVMVKNFVRNKMLAA